MLQCTLAFYVRALCRQRPACAPGKSLSNLAKQGPSFEYLRVSAPGSHARDDFRALMVWTATSLEKHTNRWKANGAWPPEGGPGWCSDRGWRAPATLKSSCRDQPTIRLGNILTSDPRQALWTRNWKSKLRAGTKTPENKPSPTIHNPYYATLCFTSACNSRS